MKNYRKIITSVLGVAVMFFAGCSDSVTNNYANLNRPEGAALVPESGERPSRLYIANPTENLLRLFNIIDATASPLASAVGYFPLEIPVGDFPTTVLATVDGNYVVVLNSLSRDISLVGVNENLELDQYPASSASLSVKGLAMQAGVTRTFFGDEAEPLRIANIYIAPSEAVYEPTQADEAGTENESDTNDISAELPQKAKRSLLFVSLPSAHRVEVLDFDPVRFTSGKEAFQPRGTYEFEENFSPSLMRLSQNGDFLWVTDETEPRLARLQLRELSPTLADSWRPPGTDTSMREALASDEKPYVGRIDYMNMPGVAWDIEAVPKLVYQNYAYQDRLYILDRDNAFIYIVTADTFKMKDPYARREGTNRPGISLGDLSAWDIAMTDFYRPYYFSDSSGCEGQAAWVISLSGVMFAVDVGGCRPFVEGATAAYPAHLPHHLLDVDPKTAEIDQPGIILPDGSLVDEPETTAPVIVNGDDEEKNFGFEFKDGQTYSQLWTMTFRGYIPPMWDAPSVSKVRADVSGLIVTMNDPDINLIQSGVEVGDYLEIQGINIVSSAVNDGSGDAGKQDTNETEGADESDETVSTQCPLSSIVRIEKNDLILADAPPERCQGKSLLVGFRAREGWVIIGSNAGYIGRQYEDEVVREFPAGRSGWQMKFAMKVKPDEVERQTDTKIVFKETSNMTLLKVDAATAYAESYYTTSHMPTSVTVGRQYPDAPLRMYVIYGGSDVVVPINLELHDLFTGLLMQ